MTTKPPLDELAAVLADASFAILYGSAASERLTDESDLDIAVAFNEPLAFSEHLDLVVRLEQAAGRRVDLVDLLTADPILRMQVVRYGRPLLVNDQTALHRFKMYSIALYLDLKLARRPVERAMVAGRTG